MGTLVAPNELKVQLIAVGSRIHGTRGTFLFRRADAVTGIFLISNGAVRLGLEEEPPAFPSRHVGPGAVLGLPAALSNSPYSLSAEVLEDSELVYLSRERLIDLLRDKPDLSMLVIEVLTEELTQTRSALERVRKVVG
ncbi:MAG: Crp/Fnr family transcriptional regulator [Terriglobales bacterium]